MLKRTTQTERERRITLRETSTKRYVDAFLTLAPELIGLGESREEGGRVGRGGWGVGIEILCSAVW